METQLPGEPQVHVISVGTSVLTNARRKLGEEVPSPQEEERLAQLAPEIRTRLLRLVAEHPWETAAELHAMRPFLEGPAGAVLVDEAHLIVTDTAAGRLCADVLETTLGSHGVRHVTRDTLPAQHTLHGDVDDAYGMSFVDGLVDLRERLLSFVRRTRERGRFDVLLNATGGFKPEVAVLVLVGGLVGAPVYYIHEVFKRTVFLPPLCLPHDRAAQLASYLTRFPESRRLAGPAAWQLHADLLAAGLWHDALHLRVLHAECAEGATIPHVIALMPSGLYLVASHGKRGGD
jgi:putative CRISPR-associated protein (TIGR02619 family)